MPAPQQNQSDNSAGILWSIAAIFGAAVFVWYNWHGAIIYYFLQLKLAEISLISFFTSNLEETKATIQAVDPDKINMAGVFDLGSQVGYYLRIPAIVIILGLAVIVYVSSNVRLFKRKYGMRELLTLEQTNWPQVVPVANLDLIKTDIDKGPWAMALTPMQFCKRNRLLEEYRKPIVEGMTRKEMNKIDVKLKRGQANKVFATQLGPLWAGVERLPPHTRALFAIFAAKANSDPAAGILIKQISASANSKLNFNGIDKLLKKYINDKNVQKILQTHAYVFTVMASMLEYSRSDGVFASADFLWLKPIDRRLWYTLNTVGRQTPFVEVAGIFAHWVAEKEIDRKLLIPVIEEATNALELALSEIIYKPEEA